MFSLKEFIFRGIQGMIGNEPDYKVIEYSAAWYDKGVLTEIELAEIDKLITAKNEALEVEYVEVEDGMGSDN